MYPNDEKKNQSKPEPYLLELFDVKLEFSLVALEFWTHVHAGTDEGDRIFQSSWFIWVRDQACPDGIFSFLITLFFQLNVSIFWSRVSRGERGGFREI